MISPELLRRYPFFVDFTPDHLNTLAMLAEEQTYVKDEVILRAGLPADTLYFLIEGGVDLHYEVIDELNPELRKDFFISEMNPGEPFGISALLEPYRYGGTVYANNPSRVLKFDAGGVRALCELDSKICSIMMRRIAQAMMSRLRDTRVQLAAARV
jgi:CRP-like cAMP-binding protein